LYQIRSTKNKKSVDLTKAPILVETVSENKEQQIHLLHKAISELKESDRLIITLLLEEVPYSEIAKITEISEANLRVKIHRIKQQLSIIYAKYERL
jgi:RNA polymerase sigma-70 factor (ECF subfamily)